MIKHGKDGPEMSALPTSGRDALPHEDRTFGGRLLYVDLVPRSCFFTNARSHLTRRDWVRLREYIYARAGNRCEVCDRARTDGRRARLDAHERWSFDEATRTQRLVRLLALCEPCHSATHFGLAELRGAGDRASAQLRDVNGWTEAQARQHILDAFTQWQARNAIKWTLDLALLADAGFSIIRNDSSAERAQHAERSLILRA
jgi:hypothetical protein